MRTNEVIEENIALNAESEVCLQPGKARSICSSIPIVLIAAIGPTIICRCN